MQEITNVLGTSVAEFMKKPWKDRKNVYRDALTADGFLLKLDPGVQDEEEELLGPALLLLKRDVTGNKRLSEEAQRIYYSHNAFRVRAPWLREFFGRRHREDGHFDPRLWVRRLSIMLYRDDEDEEEEQGVVAKTLQFLMKCDRLRDVTFEIKDSGREGDELLADLLNSTQPSLQELDRRLERGVMVIREKAVHDMGGYLEPEVVPLP
ncbi:hypothetical protein VTN96DRAFT_7130 [Rasamsonia emersonii]|uniref:Uncharacterized protein n=1 Tax=Rasamsonia emersonii (strain ATCC 16479 / CBS 393.64 / IMI 116815) TaxID=1408163 RepID=A0A0F4Z7E6_RASE3|nr:hypothetical protein T310_0164 [Rasamsonia emersonii CBS 393.64]KKA25778.1 hypothetical protein T310_0164 [Rasamsonia emersonii CBS 393.64]